MGAGYLPTSFLAAREQTHAAPAQSYLAPTVTNVSSPAEAAAAAAVQMYNNRGRPAVRHRGGRVSGQRFSRWDRAPRPVVVDVPHTVALDASSATAQAHNRWWVSEQAGCGVQTDCCAIVSAVKCRGPAPREVDRPEYSRSSVVGPSVLALVRMKLTIQIMDDVAPLHRVPRYRAAIKQLFHHHDSWDIGTPGPDESLDPLGPCLGLLDLFSF